MTSVSCHLTSLIGMMFLSLAVLSLTEAFTIPNNPVYSTSTRQSSLTLNVAMDPRTLGLELEQEDQFPLPHSSNPYVILGLKHTPSTTISELKNAYRRAVLLYHPDTRDRFWEHGDGHGNKNSASEDYNDFRRINAAYETIYRTLFGFAPCTRVSSRLNP